VRVELESRKKRIIVADNGRGMDWFGLQNFFVMHGENIDRSEGRPGRGRFGTGKSAAFGIGESLRVRTVRNRRRSTVELLRSDVQDIKSGGEIPVRIIEREVPTGEGNGTAVEIDGIHLRSLDQPGIIRYIERHLLRWPKNCTVFVNNHECEFNEPPVGAEYRYRTEGESCRLLGDVELVLKIAKAPLEEDLRGVSIFSKGVWHETTLAGSEGREMAQYIFGELDVPMLDSDDSPISPFDLSRSMHLNPNNEIVQAVSAFIGQKIELLRRELVEADRKQKATEEARRLQRQAADIAAMINGDFNEYRRRLAKVKAVAPGTADIYEDRLDAGAPGEDLVFGAELPAEPVQVPETPSASGKGGATDSCDPDLAAVLPGGPESPKRGRAAGDGRGPRRAGGGFDVRFDHLGFEAYRATYVRQERSIYVNLDHPQVAAAKQGRSAEDPTFRRLVYEVAFAEYAVALASELASNNEYLDASDPIVDIRECLNRLARKAAILYAET
jgi:hypothetical protein